MNRRGCLVVAVGITLWIALTGNAEVLAYEIETHRAISEVAASRSTVDGQLKKSLANSAGIEGKVREQSLLKWILDGSVHADDWTYPLNHFHNPLAGDWSQAGLPPFYSAIVWGQTLNQGYPSWSWQNTRQYFLDALTSPQKADRDLALTMAFKGLGHLIHLIQDMASPAHTRNDPHRSYNYETLVKEVQLATEVQDGVPVAQTFLDWLNRPSPKLDPGWQTLPPNDSAPIPIARLVDTDRYSGVNPEATIQPLMGLAEYTNANYFSEDRTFRENEIFWRFPYPRRSSVTQADYGITLGDGTPVMRQYFRKDFHGDSGYRLATVGFLRDYLQRYRLDPDRYRESPALDEAVYRDYAERLLPRAVGYSTALLDYFFRGNLEAKIEADPADSEKLQLTAKNASSEPLGGGTLAVYGDYAGGERRPLGSWPVEGPVAPGVELPSQSVSPDHPVPERYMVVYQGSLGEEKKDSPPGFGGAVIGKAVRYGGILEQLFVNPADGDVYFRNGTLVTKLNVRPQLRPGSLVFLRSWGTRNDTFLVEGGVPGEDVSHFYVFTLNRPRPDQVFRDPPVATLVRGPEFFDPFFMRSQLPAFARPQLLNYLAVLDDDLNVILHGDYCLDLPDPYHFEREECHALVVNHTARTIVFDLTPSTLGAPNAAVGFTGVIAPMVLRLDASNPGNSRIVVGGAQHIPSDNEEHDNDVYRGYLGIVDGTGSVVTTLMGWEPFRTACFPEGFSVQRRGRHLLWVKSDDNDPEGNNTRVYLSSLVDGTSTEIGVGGADVESVVAASLLSVAPDHLLRTASPAYFVKGWTADGTVVLPRVGTPGFPPEDPDFASLKRLADLPPGVSMTYFPLWQVIEDPDLIR